MTFSGTRVTGRPSLAVALVRVWRTWHEHEPLLPVGPAPTADSDRLRAVADLRATPRVARPEP